MGWETIINGKLADIINRLNSLTANSRKINELPSVTEGEKSFAVWNDESGKTEQMFYADILTDLAQNQSDRLLSVDGDVTITSDETTYTATVPLATWMINFAAYGNDEVEEITAALTAEGFTRYDLIVGNTENEIVRVQGTATEDVAVAPNIPLGTVLIAQIFVTHTGTEPVDPPIISDIYIKKAESRVGMITATSTATVLNNFPINDRCNFSIYEFGAFYISDIKGLNFSAGFNADYKRPGQIFTFRNNNLTHNITFHHDAAAGTVKLKLIGAENYILKPSETIRFRLNNLMTEVEQEGVYVPEISVEDTDSYRFDGYTTFLNNKSDEEARFVRINGTKILCIYRHSENYNEVNADGCIYKMTSNDNGKTFTTPTLIYNSVDYDDRNHVAGLCPNGNIVIAFRRFDPLTGIGHDYGFITSTDEGVTWSAYTPVGVTTIEQDNYTPFGKLIIRENKVGFVTYVRVSGPSTGVQKAYLWESTDNGLTFPTSTLLYSFVGGNSLGEPFLIDFPNGKSLIFLRNNTTTSNVPSVYQLESNDGYTFSATRHVTNINAGALNGNNSTGFPFLDGDNLIVMFCRRYRTAELTDNNKAAIQIYIQPWAEVVNDATAYDLKHEIIRPRPNLTSFAGYPEGIEIEPGHWKFVIGDREEIALDTDQYSLYFFDFYKFGDTFGDKLYQPSKHQGTVVTKNRHNGGFDFVNSFENKRILGEMTDTEVYPVAGKTIKAYVDAAISTLTTWVTAQIAAVAATVHWTKTGNKIRNNNTDDVEVKLQAGKKLKGLNASDVEKWSVEDDGDATFADVGGNYARFNMFQVIPNGGLTDGSGTAQFLKKVSGADNSWETSKRIDEKTDQSASYTGLSLVNKTFVEGAISAAAVGALKDRGNYDASSNLFPSTGGSGTAGAVMKGDLWTVSVGGTLGGVTVTVGDVVRSLIDTPGQTAGNWVVTENNLGYVPANDANTVHKTGAETIAGVKTFSDAPVFPGSATSFLMASGAVQPASAYVQTRPISTDNVSGATTPITSTNTVRESMWLLQNQITAAVVINATTAALTSANLNSTYAGVPIGTRIICKDIATGGRIYTKVTEAGSSDVWVESAITIVA